ncbi:MAG: HEAT repeat domain-containing protein [Gemmatimonadota bacterium]|nr:MAG: HEAT repeat domain-containing protein [Gemmatimonadota bacterium]
MLKIKAGIVVAAGTVVLVLWQPEALFGQRVDGEGRQYVQALAAYRDVVAYPVSFQEPKDSLYRAARRALNDGDFHRAAELFEEYYSRNPEAGQAAQALYYQAYALYKGRSEEELREAKDRLRLLYAEHSDATVALKEARALQAYVDAALARMGDAGAAEELALRAYELQAEAERREHCASEEGEIRTAALDALMQMNPEQALPIVRKVLAERDESDECAIEMRRRAVFVLARHRGDESRDILLDVVRNDPVREVRVHAVHLLGGMPGEETLAALEGILSDSEDLELQRAALAAIGHQGGEQAERIVRDVAMRKSAPLELRIYALQVVGRGSARADARFLRELYRQSSERELREGVIAAIAQHEDEETASWLLGIAMDESEPLQLRSRAMFMAARAGIASADLAARYDQLVEAELKEQVILSLSRRLDDTVALDKVLDIARNEKDVELRKKAIFWLSRSDDPRVAQLLVEIIEGGGD